MVRTVADAAAMLTPLAGPDPRDPMSQASAPYAGTDYSSFLQADALQGARIGVERSYFGQDRHRDDLMEQAIVDMAAEGATIIDPASLDNRGEYDAPAYQLMLYEFKADLQKYFSTVSPELGMRTLEDLIAFNEANADREMPYFGQEILIAANEMGPLTDMRYLELKETARRLSQEEGIDRLMGGAPTGRNRGADHSSGMEDGPDQRRSVESGFLQPRSDLGISQHHGADGLGCTGSRSGCSSSAARGARAG